MLLVNYLTKDFIKDINSYPIRGCIKENGKLTYVNTNIIKWPLVQQISQLSDKYLLLF